MKKAVGIRAKIFSGFVAILFVLALVATIGTLQSLKTGAVVGESAARHAEAAAVSRIDRDLASMRGNVTNFAYSGDDAMAAAARRGHGRGPGRRAERPGDPSPARARRSWTNWRRRLPTTPSSTRASWT